MTPQEIRDAIAADPALATLAAVRNDAAIAVAPVFSGQTTLSSRMVGTGTILAVFGAVGGQFLDLLQAVGAVDRNIHWLLTGNILRGEFDVGQTASQAGLAGLKAALPGLEEDATLRAQYEAGIDALMALGYVPSPVPVSEISKALNEA